MFLLCARSLPLDKRYLAILEHVPSEETNVAGETIEMARTFRRRGPSHCLLLRFYLHVHSAVSKVVQSSEELAERLGKFELQPSRRGLLQCRLHPHGTCIVSILRGILQMVYR